VTPQILSRVQFEYFRRFAEEEWLADIANHKTRRADNARKFVSFVGLRDYSAQRSIT
jgi:hypothetical protein